jgi:hypothetical protein
MVGLCGVPKAGGSPVWCYHGSLPWWACLVLPRRKAGPVVGQVDVLAVTVRNVPEVKQQASRSMFSNLLTD